MEQENIHGSGAENNNDRKFALAITTLGALLSPFMASSINIALPAISKEFMPDALVLSWIPTSFLLSAAVFLVPFGKIADIYGRKKIFIYGICVFAASSLLCALSTSVPMLIAFRVLQGIGAALMFGTGTAILVSIYPANEKGRALGINVTAVYIGLSLGPLIGGFLTDRFGWRSIFLAMLPLCAIVIILIFWKLKGEWAEARGERFDFAGSLFFIFSIISLMYGFSRITEIAGILLIIAGLSFFYLFIRWEIRQKNPVVDLSLFRGNAAFTFSNAAAFINYSATFAVGFLLSLYLQYIKGFSAESAGLVLVCQPVVQAVFSPFAGWLSDRIEPRLIATTGMAFTALGFLLLFFISETTPVLFIIAGLALFGFGFALFSSPNTNAVMSSVDKKFYGVASSILGTMRLSGQMFSMGIAMLVFAICIGETHIRPEIYPRYILSFKVIIVIFAVLSAGGIIASMARGRIR